MQAKLTGREYLRVSDDKSGEERSQDEQHDENARACHAHGITLGTPYREPGSRSASRYATKAREVYATLIADLEQDRFGADVLVLWESSRGSRRVGEWVTLIEVCEERGVRIFVTTHGRLYDPANARDRRSMLEDAVDSEYESAKTRERAKRASASAAAKGRPGGQAPYGYVRTYDQRTRKLVAQKPLKTEAPVIRDLFKRLHRGESFRSIARVFEGKGILRRSGTPFTPQHLRSLARCATYAGLRAHRDDTPVEGTWTALVKREVWNDVQALLDRPERRTSRPGRGVHLLSMIALCDPCGGPLAATNRGERGPQYQCHHKGCVRIRKVDLDDLVEAAVVAFMGDETNVTALAQSGADPDEIATVRQELSAVTRELADLRAAGKARKVSVATVVAIEPGLVEQIAALSERERSLSAPPEVVEFQRRGRDAAERWLRSDTTARRALLRLLVPGQLGAVRVTRRPVRGSRYVPADQRVVWASE